MKGKQLFVRKRSGSGWCGGVGKRERGGMA